MKKDGKINYKMLAKILPPAFKHIGMEMLDDCRNIGECICEKSALAICEQLNVLREFIIYYYCVNNIAYNIAQKQNNHFLSLSRECNISYIFLISLIQVISSIFYPYLSLALRWKRQMRKGLQFQQMHVSCKSCGT